jgi:hypothetical protein
MPWSGNPQRQGRDGEEKTPWIVEDCERLKGLSSILSVEEVQDFVLVGLAGALFSKGPFRFFS